MAAQNMNTSLIPGTVSINPFQGNNVGGGEAYSDSTTMSDDTSEHY